MASRKSRNAGSVGKKRGAAPVRAMLRRDVAPPRSVEEFFGDGSEGHLLKGEYHTEKVYAWFQKRHKKGQRFIEPDGFYRRNGHEWAVPYGVRYMLTQPLLPAQVSQKYPFMVTWVSPKTHKRLTKMMMSLPHAIVFVAERAQYVDSHATIVNRLGVDIPPGLRNKLPKPWKWCPRCMKPRKMKRMYHSDGTPQTFYAQVKTWHVTRVDRRGKEIGYWEYPEKKLALMHCPICGVTNREQKFRRSNQPWHKTRVRRGRTRVRRGK